MEKVCIKNGSAMRMRKAPQAGANAVRRLADRCFGRGENCGALFWERAGVFRGREKFFRERGG